MGLIALVNPFYWFLRHIVANVSTGQLYGHIAATLVKDTFLT